MSIEAGILEDLENEPKEDAYIMTKALEKAPSVPHYLDIEFDKGKPVKLNNQSLRLVSLIERLNEIGGNHCIGRTDSIEDRIITADLDMKRLSKYRKKNLNK